MKTKEEIILDLENLKLSVKDKLEKAYELICNNPACEESAQKIRMALEELEKIDSIIKEISSF